MVITVGRQYFGSGGYRAGYKVTEGEVTARKFGQVDDNGFVTEQDCEILPKGESAKVEVWCGDCISSDGWRSLGIEGKFKIFPDGSYEEL